MATYYVAQSTKPGDSVRWEDLEAKPQTYVTPRWSRKVFTDSLFRRPMGYASELDDPITKRIEVIDECTFSDYSGGTIEQSNYRVLDKDKKASRYLVRLYGAHGTKGLAYFPKKDGEAPKPVQEYLDSLANYPLISDEDHSELESELESKAWESDGHDDFVKALGKYLDEQDPDFEHDLDIVDGEDFRERIFELWREGCDAFNVNGGSGYVCETGGSVYFYIDEWFEKASRGYVAPWLVNGPTTSPSNGSSYDVRGKLETLAHETGFDCEAMRGALSVARDAFLSGDATLQGSLLEAARIEAYKRQQDREATASEMSAGTA